MGLPTAWSAAKLLVNVSPVIAENNASAFALVKRASSTRDSFLMRKPRRGEFIEASLLGSQINAKRGEASTSEKPDSPLLTFRLSRINLGTETYNSAYGGTVAHSPRC